MVWFIMYCLVIAILGFILYRSNKKDEARAEYAEERIKYWTKVVRDKELLTSNKF